MSDDVTDVTREEHCRPGEFRCNDDQTCISRTKFCNRVRDCPDGSDELHCRTYSFTGLWFFSNSSWLYINAYLFCPVAETSQLNVVNSVAQGHGRASEVDLLVGARDQLWPDALPAATNEQQELNTGSVRASPSPESLFHGCPVAVITFKG